MSSLPVQHLLLPLSCHICILRSPLADFHVFQLSPKLRFVLCTALITTEGSLCKCLPVQLVVSRAIRTVPYPLLGENTLVLSDSMVLAKDEKGTLALMFRSAVLLLSQVTQ